MQATDEYMDIYGINRSPTGRVLKRGEPLGEGEYILVSCCWIVNGEGRFLIMRRSPKKKSYPGLWEAPGGCALKGEDSLTAALREAEEETGIVLDPGGGVCFASHLFGAAIIDHWLFRHEFDVSKVRLLEGENTDARSASWSEIAGMIKKGKFFGENDEVQEYLKGMTKSS